ncbi:hypothetical protein [Paracoccus sp. ME4]|uniref:hypothetical protein n=1 Tax=Paracoccus sp. ME4 TaxID=3138066 RepID=UPI00398BB4A1
MTVVQGDMHDPSYACDHLMQSMAQRAMRANWRCSLKRDMASGTDILNIGQDFSLKTPEYRPRRMITVPLE